MLIKADIEACDLGSIPGRISEISVKNLFNLSN